MYFTKLTVNNVRCFGRNQELDLNDQSGKPALWTVILGENGVGKTTLLQSIATAWVNTNIEISKIRAAAAVRTASKSLHDFTMFAPMQSKEGTSGCDLSWTMARPAANESNRRPKHTYDFSMHIMAPPEPPMIRPRLAAGVHTSMPELPRSLVSYPLFAYGAGRRFAGGEAESTSSSFDSLFSSQSTLRNAAKWLMRVDYATRLGKPSDRSNSPVRKVTEILCSLLPDVSAIDIGLSKDGTDPQVLFTTPYGRVTIDQLSHGYQTMIAWTVDMASRMVEAYPKSDNPLSEPAICLVDEVDLHMHPRWQREIMGFLSERFPKTQFIVTAHSPLIVQTSRKENVVLLRRDGDHVVIENRKDAVRGWRFDQILTSDLFGLDTARPPEYAKILQERSKLLGKKRLSTAERKRLEELDRIAEDLPVGETAEDRDAMDIIRRAAARLKQAS